MSWAVHIVCMEEMRNAQKILSRDDLEDLDVDGKIIQ
jgi:hypothetical protein